jgi:hypothetical protein
VRGLRLRVDGLPRRGLLVVSLGGHSLRRLVGGSDYPIVIGDTAFQAGRGFARAAGTGVSSSL